MSKLIELKYVDALSKLSDHIIFNCDNVSTIEMIGSKDDSLLCSAVINMIADNKKIIINFNTLDERENFLDTLSENLINTKADGYLKIEL